MKVEMKVQIRKTDGDYGDRRVITLTEPGGVWQIGDMVWVSGRRRSPCREATDWIYRREIRWCLSGFGSIMIIIDDHWKPEFGVTLILAGDDEALGNLLLTGEAKLAKRIPDQHEERRQVAT